MRRTLIGIFLIFVLTGCSGPTPTATPTPDIKTTSGYRTFLLAQVAVMNGAVDAVNTTCREGDIAKCRTTLGERRPVYETAKQAIRTTTPPQPCILIFSGYVALPDLADPFFSEVQTEADQANATGMQTVLDRRYPPYARGQGVASSPDPRDQCK